MGTGWLVAYGANPIFLFVLSELGRMIGGMKGITDSTGGWQSYWMVGYKIFLSIGDPKAASALFALTYMLILGLIAEAMYRRGWIVKV
jgi:predicted acyltransferase